MIGRLQCGFYLPCCCKRGSSASPAQMTATIRRNAQIGVAPGGRRREMCERSPSRSRKGGRKSFGPGSRWESGGDIQNQSFRRTFTADPAQRDGSACSMLHLDLCDLALVPGLPAVLLLVSLVVACTESLVPWSLVLDQYTRGDSRVSTVYRGSFLSALESRSRRTPIFCDSWYFLPAQVYSHRRVVTANM